MLNRISLGQLTHMTSIGLMQFELERYRYPRKFNKQIYEIHKTGQSVRKLSSEYGVPTGTIYKWVSELKPFTTSEEGGKINKQEFKAMK